VGVTVQGHADRILRGLSNATTVEQMGETASLTVAVRSVLRAGEMARLLAPGEDAARIREAIEEFKRALPDIVAARDVLEHFDDYEIGIGNAQDRERRTGRSTTDYRMSYVKGAESYVFPVGHAPNDFWSSVEPTAKLHPELGVVWLCWSVGGAGGDESGLIGVDHGLDAVA
jgi:hypothetical protein